MDESQPYHRVEIEGHCDDIGSDEYNLALGAKRAQIAKDFLVSHGVSADRLVTISYGKEAPPALSLPRDAGSKSPRPLCRFYRAIDSYQRPLGDLKVFKVFNVPGSAFQRITPTLVLNNPSLLCLLVSNRRHDRRSRCLFGGPVSSYHAQDNGRDH